MPYELWLVPDVHRARLDPETFTPAAVRLLQAAIRALDSRFQHRTELTWGVYQDTREDVSAYHWRIDILPYERGGGRFKYLAGSELQMDAFLCDVAPCTTVAEVGPLLRAEGSRP
jgi:UDPglucose--hexose-1-phosphate uridylyltransferase